MDDKIDHTDKIKLAFGYYKYLQEQKVYKYNNIESVRSPDKFHSNITHADLNRMRQLKQIPHSVYEELFQEVTKRI